jgi:hypothetical protein
MRNESTRFLGIQKFFRNNLQNVERKINKSKP